ncbi:MAG: PHB depolymerase family esterase, partial [Holophagales bacterium]|nr:PHB depolymerase family esterase [Holophagales bacterium]
AGRLAPCHRRMLPVLLGVLLLPAAALAGTFGQESYGGRAYWLFVPSGYQAGTPAPLVVMLHGCTQSGDGFATSTGMNALAEAGTFLVAYPQQPSSANSSRCWNWFQTTHQSRGSGEPALLAGTVADIEASYSIDPSRRYVAGFSAGAAMAAILGATYPDVFQAIGVHSGLEYKAATSTSGAFTAMFSGGPPADPQGQLAYDAMGPRARVVSVMVIHGTSDFTVATVNGDLALSQWAQTNDLASDGVDQDDIDDSPELVQGGQVPGGRSFTRFVYEDASGDPVMEKILVDSMGHNWSGGALGGTFTDPDGPDASQLLVDFFLGTAPAPDTTPPTTTASPSGGTYGAAVSVTLDADEPATTYYTTDGSIPIQSSPVYSSPIPITDDATLRFFSVDAASNTEAVRTEIYVIDPGGDTTPPVTTASPAGGSYSSAVSVALSADEPATTYFTTDGSTPTTSSAVYTAPIPIRVDTTLRFFSVDAASNAEAVRTEIYTFSSSTTLTLTSIDSEDGYAGQLWVDGVSTSIHRAGDKGFFNTDTYRLFLSFDTSAIPIGATVTGATLTIHRASLQGAVSQLQADVADTSFGSSASLVQSDYSAASSLYGAFSVAVPASDGAATSADLPPSTLGLIPGSRFQIRLRASTPINFGSDVLTLHGGGAGALAPTLEVTYE